MAYFNIENFLSKVAGTEFQKSTQFRCRIPVENIGGGGRLGGQLNGYYPDACKWLAEGLLCGETRIPSRAFNTTNLGIYGLEEKYPTFTTYTDHACTFYAPLIEGKNDVAAVFHEWQNGIQRRTSRRGADRGMVMEFPDDYRLTEGMVLEQFSAYNEQRRGGILGVNINAQGNVRDIIQNVNRVTRLFNGRQIPTSWTNRMGNLDEKDSEPSLSYEFFNVFPQTIDSAPLDWAGVGLFQTITVNFTYSYWSLKQPEDPLAFTVQ